LETTKIKFISNFSSKIAQAGNMRFRQHVADAELEAARLQDLMLDRGDDEGRLVWVRIRRAIEALRQCRPTGRTKGILAHPAWRSQSGGPAPDGSLGTPPVFDAQSISENTVFNHRVRQQWVNNQWILLETQHALNQRITANLRLPRP